MNILQKMTANFAVLQFLKSSRKNVSNKYCHISLDPAESSELPTWLQLPPNRVNDLVSISQTIFLLTDPKS